MNDNTTSRADTPSILYTPHNPQQEVAPKGKTWTLQELQEHVGGYIELVRHLRVPGMVMVVNDAGRVTGLAPNVPASDMAGQHIVGPVLVTPDWMVE